MSTNKMLDYFFLQDMSNDTKQRTAVECGYAIERNRHRMIYQLMLATQLAIDANDMQGKECILTFTTGSISYLNNARSKYRTDICH